MVTASFNHSYLRRKEDFALKIKENTLVEEMEMERLTAHESYCDSEVWWT